MSDRKPRWTWIAATIGFAVIVLRVSAQAPAASPESYQSSGKEIHLERYAPSKAGRHPTIFMLYGASGLAHRSEDFRKYAHGLADHGYVVFLLHYFDATDSATAGDLPVPQERFRIWTKALQDGISYATRDPHVDRHRIGVLGFSLGAFLALWEASQDDRVRAVVEYYGGTSMFLGPAKRMPPTLILHGEKDSFVIVERAHELERLLQQQHTPYESKIYPGHEHGFDSDDPAAAQDAWERTLAFFQKYLGGH